MCDVLKTTDLLPKMRGTRIHFRSLPPKTACVAAHLRGNCAPRLRFAATGARRQSPEIRSTKRPRTNPPSSRRAASIVAGAASKSSSRSARTRSASRGRLARYTFASFVFMTAEKGPSL